jgi:hypothetical protein
MHEYGYRRIRGWRCGGKEVVIFRLRPSRQSAISNRTSQATASLPHHPCFRTSTPFRVGKANGLINPRTSATTSRYKGRLCQ